MAFPGDAVNFVLGGIPGDIHDILNPDVDPGDLQRASIAMAQVGDTVASVHLHLNDSVAMLQGRWEGAGATAFHTDIWQPLSDGLDVLERESHNAAHQLANFAGQAAEAHIQKIMAIEQEVQTQLNITAVTWELTPAAGKALTGILGDVAARGVGETIGRIVGAIVNAIEELIRKVLAAFAGLLEKPFGFIADYIATKTGELGGPLSMSSTEAEHTDVSTAVPGDGGKNAWDANKLNHIFGKPQHGLDGVTKALGGESSVMDAAQASLHGSDMPASGAFAVTRTIGGQSVVIRGVMIGDVPRIGTMYAVP